jgi:hypothetical protein
MNVFSPYILLEDSPSEIHLKENNFRKNLHLLILRFFPVLFLSAGIFLLLASSPTIPNWANAVMIIASIVSAIFIFSRKLVTEVLITKMSIDVNYNYFFRTHKQSYPVSFIDHLAYRRRGGRAPAYIYSAVIKGDNKREPLLKIPALCISEEKRTIIKNKLETLTGLKVIDTRIKIFSGQ